MYTGFVYDSDVLQWHYYQNRQILRCECEHYLAGVHKAARKHECGHQATVCTYLAYMRCWHQCVQHDVTISHGV